MVSQSSFRSSKSRITKKQQGHIDLKNMIMMCIQVHEGYVETETLWLELIKTGQHRQYQLIL
jgi:hypothetical protein